MTTEIIQYKCPSCGHLLGEEEYEHACQRSQREVNEKVQEQLKKAEQDKLNLKIEFGQKLREIDERNKLERERDADRIRLEERNTLAIHHSQELADKDRQIELAKSQSELILNEKVNQAVMRLEEKHRQEKKEFELQRNRMQNDMEKLQKTVDNIPIELRATASEFCTSGRINRRISRR